MTLQRYNTELALAGSPVYTESDVELIVQGLMDMAGEFAGDMFIQGFEAGDSRARRIRTSRLTGPEKIAEQTRHEQAVEVHRFEAKAMFTYSLKEGYRRGRTAG